MKPEYFSDTDTLYLNLSSAAANGGEVDASELVDPEDFVFLLDASGRVVGIRIERARHRVDVETLMDVQAATDDKAPVALYTLDELAKRFGVSKVAINKTLHKMREGGIVAGQRINPDHDNSPIFLTDLEVEQIRRWRDLHKPGRPQAAESMI